MSTAVQQADADPTQFDLGEVGVLLFGVIMSTGKMNGSEQYTTDSEPKTVELRLILLRVAGPAVIATDIEPALIKQLSDMPVALGETVFEVQCEVPHQVFALAGGDELI